MPRPKKIKTEESESFTNPIDQYFHESAISVADKYGKDYVSSVCEEDESLKYLYVPDLGMQWSLGRHGLALGRIMQIMGFEGAGKTSLALWLANLCMESGGIAAMVETEQAGSTAHMKNYLTNDNWKQFRIFHPDSIEDAMSITIDQLNLFLKIDPEGKIPKVLILDSIAGATDQRAQKDEENFVQGRVGGSAKVIKDATNLIKGKLKETNTLWVVLNQGRDKIDTSFGGMIPEIEKVIGSGGRAIPFAATYWVVLKRNAATKDDGEKSGFKSKGVWKKNKLRHPWREFTYNVKWGNSFDFVEQTTKLLALSSICGFEEQKGNKFYSKEMNVGPLTAEEFYQFAHSPENISKFQQELDIINTDVILTYERKVKNESFGSDSDIPARVGPGISGQENTENKTESGPDTVVKTEAGDTEQVY
jgi:recombination protein RecA